MKILVITPIYPRNDVIKKTTATKVIHYFAKEWKKQGHEIFVVAVTSKLPSFVYVLPQKLKDIIKAKTGSEIPDINVIKKLEYEYEGVQVYRRPVNRLIPRSLPSDREIQICCKDIKRELDNKGFVPDIILAHWECPGMQILSEMNTYYNCKKSIVIHGHQYIDRYAARLKKLCNGIDAIGVRSKSMVNYVRKELSLDKDPFICYSGVPDDYISKTKADTEKLDSSIKRFIYVGELIARKNCDSLIRALAKVDIDDWSLDIIGIGNEADNLKRLSAELGVSARVHFHGRVTRDQVFELMQSAQCFIMTSKEETFGLVYLEAMLASCITVGSQGEGIDGIIENGKNGFLVEPGNDEELIQLIRKIANSNNQNNREIAQCGYETAMQFADSIVSEKYLHDVQVWK